MVPGTRLVAHGAGNALSLLIGCCLRTLAADKLRRRVSAVNCCGFGSYAANRYANGVPLPEARTVVLQAFLSNGGRARLYARKNPECAKRPEIGTDGSPDDGRTHDKGYSGKFRMK